MTAYKSKKMDPAFNLTEHEIRFCYQYAEQNFSNATQAYFKVYGGTYNTANSRAHKLLKKEPIRELLLKLQKDAYDAAFITPERVAKELANIAFAQKGDRDYPASAKLKALDLLQKQFGLQQQKIKTESEVITIEVTVDE